MKELAKLHISTYDALAEEYENRTSALTSVTQDAIDWMAKYTSKGGKILDLGCGVGLASSFLVKNGFEVTCLDISPKMIAFAKKRNPNATFIQKDFLRTKFDFLFDGVFAFAFIHLFPKDVALNVLQKIHSILSTGAILYIGSTKSIESKEGWEVKKDYKGNHERYRKHWTEIEFKQALAHSGFEILDFKDYSDPFGKIWMDFIARKI